MARALLAVGLAAAMLVAGERAGDASVESISGAPRAVAGYVPRQVLVRFRSGTSARDASTTMRRHEATIEGVLPIPRVKLLRVGPGTAPPDAARALARDPDILWAEPNYYARSAGISNDPYLSEEWGLHNFGQTIGQFKAGTADADIDVPEAWDVTKGSDDVVVGVVDSGIALSHPDLAPTIAANPGESGGGKATNGVDDDGNGFVDDVRGWDFVDDDNDPSDPALAFQHGTLAASIIAARGGDGSGVTGVAQRAQVLPVRSADATGTLTDANAAAGLAYAGMRGARVVNASFGGGYVSNAEHDAMTAHPNTLYVASAGNDSIDTDLNPVSPCTLDVPNLVCVAATGQDDELAGFSNFGASTVHLAAPGVAILGAQQPFADLFTEGFETNLDKWVQGSGSTWDRSNEAARNGTFSLDDSPGVDYSNNQDVFIRTKDPVDLSSATACRFEYFLDIATELGRDFVRVEAATDAGGPWTQVDGWSGHSGGVFLSETADLGLFAGESTVFARFRFTTDATIVDEGVHIDDVAIQCATDTPTGHDFGYGDGTSFSAPVVAGIAALVASAAPDVGPGEIRTALLGGTDSLPALTGNTVTGGRANAAKTLASIPPAAATSDATAPAAGALKLNGIARPRAGAGSYYYEYGLTDAYGHQTPARAFGATLGNLPVAETLTGMRPRAVVHYRLRVSTAAGDASGADRTATVTGGPARTIDPDDDTSPVADGARLVRNRSGRVVLSLTPSEPALLVGVIDPGTGPLRDITRADLDAQQQRIALGRVPGRSTVSFRLRDGAGNESSIRDLIVPKTAKRGRGRGVATIVAAPAFRLPFGLPNGGLFGEGSQGFVLPGNPILTAPTAPGSPPNDCLHPCAELSSGPTSADPQLGPGPEHETIQGPPGFNYHSSMLPWDGHTVNVEFGPGGTRVAVDWGDPYADARVEVFDKDPGSGQYQAVHHTYTDEDVHTVTVYTSFPDGTEIVSTTTNKTSDADLQSFVHDSLPTAEDAAAGLGAISKCTGGATACAWSAGGYVLGSLYNWCKNSSSCFLGPRAEGGSRRPRASAEPYGKLVRPRVVRLNKRLLLRGVPGRAAEPVLQLIGTQGRFRAHGIAFIGSLDRASAAVRGGAPSAASLQVVAARRFALRLVQDIKRDLRNRKAAVAALRRSGFKRTVVSKAAAARFQKKLRRNGFSPAAKRQLKAIGMTNREINGLRRLLSSAPVAASTFPDLLVSRKTLAAERQAIRNLKRFAAQMS